MKDARGHGSAPRHGLGAGGPTLPTPPGQKWKSNSAIDYKFVSDLQAARALAQKHPKSMPPPNVYNGTAANVIGHLDPEGPFSYAALSEYASKQNPRERGGHDDAYFRDMRRSDK